METITNELVEEARRLSELIPDFDSWLAEARLAGDDRLVDTVLFYVFYSVHEDGVALDELPDELVAFYQKNEKRWLTYVMELT